MELQPAERSLWLMGKTVRDFDAVVAMRDLSVSFFTQTQSDATIGDGTRNISPLIKLMRQEVVRAGAEFWHVTALEIQPKRYSTYGVLASHWHVVIGCSLPEAFPHAESIILANGRRRIKKIRDGKIITWDWLHKNSLEKFGMYFICDAWSNQVYGYLSKYLPKPGLLNDFKMRVGKKVHVFSSSHFPIEQKMNYVQWREYQELTMAEPDLLDLYWRREGSRIVGRIKRVSEREWGSGWVQRRNHYDRLISIRGEWVPDDRTEEPGEGLVPGVEQAAEGSELAHNDLIGRRKVYDLEGLGQCDLIRKPQVEDENR